MNLKADSADPERRNRRGRENVLTEYTCHHKQNLERSVNIKGTSCEERVFGNWKESNSCYKVWKFLAELSSTVGWKAESVSGELWWFAETSKQNVEEAAWFLLVAYSKTREEGDEWRKEQLSKKEPAHNDLRGSWPIRMAKDAKIRYVHLVTINQAGTLVTYFMYFFKSFF